MSQYERMVSYLYAYRDGEKGANVGYARVENRGDRCRITVQMRAVAVQNPPTVYLYQQKEHGIETILVGSMSARGTSLVCKALTECSNVFLSGKTFEEVDGIFVDVEGSICYSTTWKNDSFYLGDWGQSAPLAEETKEEFGEVGRQESTAGVSAAESSRKGNETQNSESAGGVSGGEGKDGEKNENAAAQEDETIKTELQADKDQDVQIQSICGACPFKNQMYDYGQKILHAFPTMQPFSEDFAEICVRMELKDIGCLPMKVWSLSGNRFLLHGYYCYRHLVFIKMKNGEYVLGVPGIYNEKEKRNAASFGFCDFQSIGDFGKMQGAFGYWLLNLPEE